MPDERLRYWHVPRAVTAAPADALHAADGNADIDSPAQSSYCAHGWRDASVVRPHTVWQRDGSARGLLGADGAA